LRVVTQEAEDARQVAQLGLPPATLPIEERGVVAADRLGHLPLQEAAVQARPAEVLAQGLGIFGVGGPGFASSEGDAAGWQLMHEPLGLRGPFVIRLRGRIPHPVGYPETLRTLADHLKKARLDRGIPQRDAARAIGCSPLTFLNWEKGRVAPDVRFWPAILAFLGYDLRPEPAGFGGRIKGGT
jgi:DNA-binding XRE family transcriptional regulator